VSGGAYYFQAPSKEYTGRGYKGPNLAKKPSSQSKKFQEIRGRKKSKGKNVKRAASLKKIQPRKSVQDASFSAGKDFKLDQKDADILREARKKNGPREKGG